MEWETCVARLLEMMGQFQGKEEEGDCQVEEQIDFSWRDRELRRKKCGWSRG